MSCWRSLLPTEYELGKILTNYQVWAKEDPHYLPTMSWRRSLLTEIYLDYPLPLLFNVAQGIFTQSTERLSRSTLHLKQGGEESLYSCICTYRVWAGEDPHCPARYCPESSWRRGRQRHIPPLRPRRPWWGPGLRPPPSPARSPRPHQRRRHDEPRSSVF